MDSKKRTIIQGISAILQNANIKGFFTGKIYEGDSKGICVPGLNCYSCPGAIGACPIGSLQNSLSGFSFKLPYYVVGLLIFFGVIFGRLICGFLCPFGLLQDLLIKIPIFKKIKTHRFDGPLRYLKYVILLVFVVILPIAIKLTPAFCKYICPSGTVSGLLLSLVDHRLVKQFGEIFTLKLSLLLIMIFVSIKLARPFCKYLCPLGAIYGIFNKVSIFRLTCDKDKCISCKACASTCCMNIDPSTNPNSAECIRCLKCTSTCSHDALQYQSIFKS